MTTKEAFEKLINDPELYKTLPGKEKGKVRTYRIRGANMETMIFFIESHGGVMVQDMKWKLP